MKKNHYFFAALIILYIIGSLSFLLAGQDFGLPTELHILKTISGVVLLISLSLAVNKHQLTKFTIITAVLLCYSVTIWRYLLNDIGFIGLLIFILGYSFMPFIVWTSYNYDWSTKDEVKEAR